MLSRPDFLQKQIILIGSEQLSSLQITNSTLHIKRHDQTVSKVSLHKIFCVYIVGECTITSKVFKKLADFGVIIYLLSRSLRPRLCLGNELQGNYLLRTYQYTMDHSQCLSYAQFLIHNKIDNQYSFTGTIRNLTDKQKENRSQIKSLIEKIQICDNIDSLRGLEGNAARLYFGIVFGDIGRYRRAPRTKEDMINFLLDMGYSHLYGFLESQLHMYGFDLYKGFFHQLFYERKSLLCDVIEPWRCVIDASIRKHINLKVFQEKDFYIKQGVYNLKRGKYNDYSAIFLRDILNHKELIFEYIRDVYRSYMGSKKTLPFYSHKKHAIECSSSPTT